MSTGSMAVIFRKRSISRRVSRICEPRRIMVVLQEGLSPHLDQIVQACRGFCGGDAKNLSGVGGLTFQSHWSAIRHFFSSRRTLSESGRSPPPSAMHKPTGFQPVEHGIPSSPLSPSARCRKLIGHTCIPSSDGIRPLAGVAVDTCLIHRAVQCHPYVRTFIPSGDLVPLGIGVSAFLSWRTPRSE